MSWRVSVGFAVTVSTATAGFGSVQARADEAYLCGTDRVVYVAAADLPRKKLTDPCIAAYYGLTVETPTPKTLSAPLAVRKPESKPVVKTLAILKPLADNEVPSREAAKPTRQALLEPMRSEPGADFRNVKVINASSPDVSWFRHTK